MNQNCHGDFLNKPFSLKFNQRKSFSFKSWHFKAIDSEPRFYVSFERRGRHMEQKIWKLNQAIGHNCLTHKVKGNVKAKKRTNF